MKYTIDEIVANGICIEAKTKYEVNKVLPYLRGAKCKQLENDPENPIYFVSISSVTRGNIGLGVQSSPKDIFTGNDLEIVPFDEIIFI